MTRNTAMGGGQSDDSLQKMVQWESPETFFKLFVTVWYLAIAYSIMII